MKKVLFSFLLTIFVLQGLCFAEKHCFDTFVKVKTDSGYCVPDQTPKTDIHDGWKLGEFILDGYTGKKQEGNSLIFLKNVGDKIELNFNLLQNIDAINGKDTLVVAEDNEGYDKIFNIEKTKFGRGMLIVRHTDYEGTKKVVPYNNFLVGISSNAVTNIRMLEEGDYDVALDYKLRDKDTLILDDYTDYKMYCSFKIRNSNCMVYLFDVNNGSKELGNGASVTSGFRLDLARSRYLDVSMQRTVLVLDRDDRYVEDVRENKSAKDGAVYLEEGIYTIEVSNPVTKAKTTKKIYVGSDKVLMAYVKPENAAYSLEEICKYVKRGAIIRNGGDIDFSGINKGKWTGDKIRTSLELGWKIFGNAIAIGKRIIAKDKDEDLKPILKETYQMFKALCSLYGADVSENEEV